MLSRAFLFGFLFAGVLPIVRTPSFRAMKTVGLPAFFLAFARTLIFFLAAILSSKRLLAQLSKCLLSSGLQAGLMDPQRATKPVAPKMVACTGLFGVWFPFFE